MIVQLHVLTVFAKMTVVDQAFEHRMSGEDCSRAASECLTDQARLGSVLFRKQCRAQL